MTEHSILAPSSAARRVACPGSRELESRYPDEDSDHAREGHAAHQVASDKLLNHHWMRDEETSNGVRVTLEMIEGACLYSTEIDRLKWPDSVLHIEEKVDIFSIHPEAWGTPDCWWIDDEAEFKRVVIVDYKFGHGLVDVFENWQLISYAAGILDRSDVKVEPTTSVVFCVIQPRGFHKDGPVRNWVITVENLEPYFQKLRIAEEASMQPNALCKPSPECRYCLGRHACQALQRAALTVVDQLAENVPFDLTPEQTGKELAALQRAGDLIRARVTGLEEQALHMIKAGKRISGFTVEASKGREVWKKSTAEIKALGDMFDVTLTKPDDLITPKQAIKLGVPWQVMSEFTEERSGPLKLVAVDPKEAKKIFGGSK